MLFSLDGRLSVCASLVREGAKIVDVGTDHAYLPVWLAKSGRITSAVACDVREKPLAAGLSNIEKFGCGDIVSARLSDGLDEVLPEEAEDIVIAGMGGELIVRIIDRAPWLRDRSKRLILQPMSKANEVRRALALRGFDMISETPCVHAGKRYTVMCAEFSGKPAAEKSALWEYTGALDANDPMSKEYVGDVVSKLLKKRRGAIAEGGDTEYYDRLIHDICEKFEVAT